MKIAYIDDETSCINAFRAYIAWEGNGEIEVVDFKPSYDLEGMFQEIFAEKGIDAVIVDFELSSREASNYDGAELASYILEQNPSFPCFLMTAFENRAVKSGEIDVRFVYPKSIIRLEDEDDSAKHLIPEDTNNENKISFYQKIVQQIKNYHTKIGKLEKEHAELLRKKESGTDWTLADEQRLIDVDSSLEHTFSGHKTPSALKSSEAVNKTVKLIEVTRKLLEELKNEQTSS